jgi:hypothetical protein
MRLLRLPLALAALVALGACKNPNEPKVVSTTTLKCVQPGGGTVGCDITIPDNASKVRITLVSHDCAAHGDIISISEPAATTITTDACYESVPKSIEIPGPFTSAHLAMKVTSELITNSPELRVTGSSPNWTINFEDGGDQDFNDAVLTVEAL